MRSWLLILILILGSVALYGQSASDIDLISGKQKQAWSYYDKSKGNDAHLMEVNKGTVLSKVNPVNWVFKGLMYTYQHMISEQMAANCTYELSCSNFGKQSIREFGLVKGVFITADRLMRCNHTSAKETSQHTFTPEGKMKDDVTRYRK